MRLGQRAAIVAVAALATTASASALAGQSPLPAQEPSPAAHPKRVRHVFQPPPHAFPILARPEYGDGIGAGRGHEGQDMFAPAGTALVAVARGTVIETGSNGGAGNYVSIYDPAAKRTYNYFHMLAPAVVHGGERVRAGQKLGELGCSGSCWGNHLHFEVRVGHDPWGPVLDPMPTLRRLSADLAFSGRLRAS